MNLDIGRDDHDDYMMAENLAKKITVSNMMMKSTLIRWT